MRSRTALCVAATLAACGGGEGGPTGSGGVASVRMVATTIMIFPGQTEQLAATPLDANGAQVAGAGNPIWRSSNTSVASVTAAGVVTGVTVGTTDVTASFGSVTGTTRVTVAAIPMTALVSMPGLTFTPFRTFIRRGGTVQFEFPQLPHNVIFASRAGAPADIQITSNVRLSRTFATAGLFPYDCTLHPGMSGEVEVVP
ncbi:MAG: cupredoxin domain-containing protein [Gemmatimonadota bacterium]